MMLRPEGFPGKMRNEIISVFHFNCLMLWLMCVFTVVGSYAQMYCT